jgi:hypothetical protein
MSRPTAEPALHRLPRARADLDLDDRVRIDHRCFLLEDVNALPIPKKYLDAEIPVVGSLEPELGWKPWQARPATWPVTTAPANETVHAAKQQSLRADGAYRQFQDRDPGWLKVALHV